MPPKAQELPPLARGILKAFTLQAVSAGITPARAGNTLTFLSLIVLLWNYPRSRGEYTVSQAILD